MYMSKFWAVQQSTIQPKTTQINIKFEHILRVDVALLHVTIFNQKNPSIKICTYICTKPSALLYNFYFFWCTQWLLLLTVGWFLTDRSSSTILQHLQTITPSKISPFRLYGCDSSETKNNITHYKKMAKKKDGIITKKKNEEDGEIPACHVTLGRCVMSNQWQLAPAQVALLNRFSFDHKWITKIWHAWIILSWCDTIYMPSQSSAHTHLLCN